MPRTKSVDHGLLEAALEGLELQRQRIEEQIRQVRGRLGQRGPRGSAAKASPAPAQKRPRRKLSEQARKRIAAAQKKRWAAFRKKAAGSASAS